MKGEKDISIERFCIKSPRITACPQDKDNKSEWKHSHLKFYFQIRFHAVYLLVQDIGNVELPSSINDLSNENAAARQVAFSFPFPDEAILGPRLVSQCHLRQGSHHAP
ncbi:MAG: hypothetical protein EZS28_011306 [Streblomastix strix]|uniref:Uncharacterized protein n=1 Tax=Streblomastix strix TaxID=222440 RepID=A0A5J4WFN7_9EUKA|nr:MAG: hypothetical protein EZS28_011306 [Streblomastix strix]